MCYWTPTDFNILLAQTREIYTTVSWCLKASNLETLPQIP